MWASGNWKKGTTPQKVLKLDGDRMANAPKNMQHAVAIAERLYKYLPNKK